MHSVFCAFTRGIGIHQVAFATFARQHPQFTTRQLSSPRCISRKARPEFGQHYLSKCEEDTQSLAGALAHELQRGDLICLRGTVGAGKSAFCRAFIRAACNDEFMEVPSPTFVVQNTYDLAQGLDLHHFDLYRIEDKAWLSRLDLGACFQQAVNLIEWPERMGELPPQRLDVHISLLNPAEQEEVFHLHPALEEDQRKEEEDPYADNRYRRIFLNPHGESWGMRLATIRERLVSSQADIFQLSSAPTGAP